jgi:hypothetical protein
MTLIQVPKPPKSAMGKNRRISTLLKNQICHLQEAELRLPARMQTNIYVNAIQTEGEAADYIRRVTEALHEAHGVYPQGIASNPGLTSKASPRFKRLGSKRRKSTINGKA